MQNIFKELSGKKIAMFAALATLSGLVFEMVAYFGIITTRENAELFWNIKCISPNLQLGVLNSDIMHYYVNGSAIFVNLFNVLIYITGLVGLVIFCASKFREVRLIRFFFSVVFLAKTISLFYMVTNAVRWFSNPAFNLFVWLLNFVTVAIWCYIAFLVLRHYMHERELDVDNDAEDEFGAKGVYEVPGKLQRLFHWIVDSIIAVGVCSALLASFYKGVICNDYFGNCTSVESSFIKLLSLFVSYVLFEWLFGATPGKMLTESRTIKSNGGKLTLAYVLGRTFARFIPFEAFSFFTYGDGWHDLLSKTTVVKEKRTGMSGRWFWLLPLGYLLVIVGGYYGNEALERHRFRQKEERNYNRYYNQMRGLLNKVSPSTIIKLKAITGEYSSDYILLKVEKVSSGTVEASIIPDEEISNLSVFALRYAQMKPLLERVKISMDDLSKGLSSSMSDYRNNKIEGFVLPNDKHRYAIDDFVLIDGPLLCTGGNVSFSSGMINFVLETKGCSADLVAAKNIEGDMDWGGTLPLHINSTNLKDNYQNEVQLVVNNSTDNKNVKCILTLKDSLGGMHQFRLAVTDKVCTIDKIN